MEKKVCPTKLSQFRRSSTSGQVSSKVGDLSPTGIDLSQQLASRRKNFPDKSGLLSTLTPATALPFPSTHSFILHWVVFFGRMQDTTAALYLKNISYHRWFLYSVTLSNLPWSARMIHIKIWSLRILKNTFCPLWELGGNQIMTSLGACSTFSCWPGTTWVLLCGWPLGTVPAAATLVMLGFPGHLRFFLEAVTSQRLSYQDGRFSSKKQQQDGWSSSANCWQKTSEWPSTHPSCIYKLLTMNITILKFHSGELFCLDNPDHSITDFNP